MCLAEGAGRGESECSQLQNKKAPLRGAGGRRVFMSTRDKILTKMEFLTEEQLQGLYMFLESLFPDEEFNAETLAAFAEVDDMKKHPEDYKGYDDIGELFEELRK